jgi:site-specific DNA recombinase
VSTELPVGSTKRVVTADWRSTGTAPQHPDQLANSRKYAEDRGRQVVGEFVDQDKSAFRKVDRKGFEALLAAVDAGKIEAIITRHQDRLTRNPETYGRLLEICVRHGILIHLYTGGALDLATHAGGFWG